MSEMSDADVEGWWMQLTRVPVDVIGVISAWPVSDLAAKSIHICLRSTMAGIWTTKYNRTVILNDL
jgi:hypothetical protein